MEAIALTPYEAEQVARIADWKGQRPGFVARAVESLKWPLDHLLTRFLPAEDAREMFSRVHRAADWDHGRDVIRRAAGIDHVVELRQGPLEHCDGLVKKVRDFSRETITAESLLASVGGLATELLQLPAEVMLALRTVHRVAACYGYELDYTKDETLVLGIIGLSLLTEPDERLRARRLIRELEEGRCPRQDKESLEHTAETRLEDEVGGDLVEQVGSALLEEKIGEGIPFVGAALGVVLDAAFIDGVEETAHRTFQERWLREHGKVDEIAPSLAPRTVATFQERLSGVAYSASYAVSFGVVFPVVLAARASSAVLPDPAASGCLDGSRSARRDVDHWLAGTGGESHPALAGAG